MASRDPESPFVDPLGATKERPEESRLYSLAMLKVSMDQKKEKDWRLQEVLQGIMEGLNIEPKELQAYLEKHRETLVTHCREKGYFN